MSDPVDPYPEIRQYLEIMARMETARGIGMLDVVAARAKVAEGDLRDIVENGTPIDDRTAAAVANQALESDDWRKKVSREH